MKQTILLILVITILAIHGYCGKIFAENLLQTSSTTMESKAFADISSKEALVVGGLGLAYWPNADTVFISLEIPKTTTYSHVINLGVFPKDQLYGNYDKYLVLEFTWQKYFRERKVNKFDAYGGVGIGYYWKTEKNSVLFNMFHHNGPYLSLTTGITYTIFRSISIINICLPLFIEAEYWVAPNDNNILYRIGFK